jgi:1-deoxy-D-xylulose-5-phosphate synthase
MSFEAINHAGHLQKNLIVILNDNAYSISKNVGALQSYLASMLVSRSYNTLKGKVWELSQSLPVNMRRTFVTGAQKIEESLINILVPNIIFEDLGFKYVGPIDGHDIARMVRIFHKAQHNVVGPILIHLVTQKGRGYEIAENDARHFHGVGTYDEKTGHSLKTGCATYPRYSATLCAACRHRQAHCGHHRRHDRRHRPHAIRQRFPDRFFDVGIADSTPSPLPPGSLCGASSRSWPSIPPFCNARWIR